MSTTKFVFNPFTGNLDEMVNTIDLTTDVTGILPVANGGTGLSSLLQAGSSLYVDNNRTDTYTADGSASKPFKTLATALAQVITNNTGGFYTIIVNAGDYGTEDISLNDPAFTRIAIVAASVSNGQLSGDPIPVTTIRDITSTTNNDNLKALLISGFVFRNLTMIGASNGSTFCQYGAMISNCTQLSTATVSIDVENAGQVVFADCGFSQSSGSGNVTIQNVIAFLVYKSLFSVGTMSIITNGAINKPTGFSSTSTQFSFGSLAGAVNVDAGSAFRSRWNRILATVSNSGTMATIMCNLIGAVAINSGGTWSSTGDLVNNVPTNAGTITPTGVMYASGAKLGSLTASSPVLTDANKNLVSGSIALASQVSGTLPATNGGTAQSTYTTGDTLYASASNTLSKLAVGSSGDVLTVAGGVPTWAPNSGGSVYTYVSATDTNNTVTSAGTTANTYFQFVSGLNITLTAGTWIIRLKGMVTFETPGANFTQSYVRFGTSATPGSGLIDVDMATLGWGYAVGQTVEGGCYIESEPYVSAGDTIYVNQKWNSQSGVPISSQLGFRGDLATTVLSAIRVA